LNLVTVDKAFVDKAGIESDMIAKCRIVRRGIRVTPAHVISRADPHANMPVDSMPFELAETAMVSRSEEFPPDVVGRNVVSGWVARLQQPH
jgi:hypothetical protein